MAFAVSNMSTRQGIHEFTVNGVRAKYDSNLDLFYSWIGGLVPHWGAGVVPEPFIRAQIINATNGQVGRGMTFVNMPESEGRPEDVTRRTKVELVPVPTITLGRVPHLRRNNMVTGIGTCPASMRVDFTKTMPIPKRKFLEDMPVNSDELQGFLSDWWETYGKPGSRMVSGNVIGNRGWR